MRRFGNRGGLGPASPAIWPLPALLSLGLAWALAGCGTTPPCTSSALCRGGEVCGATGSCAALDPNAGRFSRSVWLSPADWGGTVRRELGGGEAPGDGDLLLLGGPKEREFHLAFGPLPGAGSISNAVLVLAPHQTWTPPPEGAELSIFLTEPFRGVALTRRDAPRRDRFPAARAALGRGATRLLRVDLTREVAALRTRGATWVFVAIAGGGRADDAPPLRFASPQSLRPEDRPRLELNVR